MRQAITVVLLAAFALPIWAQEEQQSDDTLIDVLTAIQGKHVAEDSSKAEEYGEVPEGVIVKQFKASFGLENDRYLDFSGQNVQLNNAKYDFAFGQSGKYELGIDYTKIPHLFSKSGETIWNETAPGVWEISDTIQQAIENINPFTPGTPDYNAALAQQRRFISGLLTTPGEVDLGLQRNRGNIRFDHSINPEWSYNLHYFKENRDGTRPFGTSFGFSWVTELPERIDYDTERFRAGVEYANNGKSFFATYDLSLFFNEIEVMTWDNPYRITDRTYSSAYVAGDGVSFGRAQLPVDNTSNSFSVGGAANFGRSRVTGQFAYSLWTDDVDLLPFGTSTAVDPIPLPASTFNGELRNLSAHLGYNTRFGEGGSFKARYRLYDQTNNNDHFFFGEYVRFDSVVEELDRPNELYAYSTNSIDLDGGWAFNRNFNWSAGYGFKRWDREDREVSQSDTNSFRTSFDARASDWVTLRLSYQYHRRRYDVYDVNFPFERPIYEVVPLRRFDLANLNRNKVFFTAEFVAGENGTLGVTAGYGNDDYPDTQFGRLEAKNHSFGLDYSYTLSERSSFNVWYEREKFESDQRGRQSGGSPSTNPLDDWTANIEDKYDTFGGGLNHNFDDSWRWELSTTYARADGDANLFSPPGGTPNTATGLPNSDETDLVTVRTGVNYRLTGRARIGAFYWFERYLIDDYAEDTIAADLIFSGSSILLNAIQPDYEYHVGWIGVTYLW
ncbi:MAG TPA: MtrB/PioB family decaheme-associated outer membrane protein [Acidobacteriota bacterium]